jgi:hypothetical protein
LWKGGAPAKAGQAIAPAKANAPKPAARQAHPNEFSKQKKAMKKADPYGTKKTPAACPTLKTKILT